MKYMIELSLIITIKNYKFEFKNMCLNCICILDLGVDKEVHILGTDDIKRSTQLYCWNTLKKTTIKYQAYSKLNISIQVPNCNDIRLEIELASALSRIQIKIKIVCLLFIISGKYV